MSRLLCLVVIGMAAVAASPAAAQNDDGCACANGSRSGECCAVRVDYIFNDELVGGTVLRPTEDLTLMRQQRALPRLIKIRGSFMDEMFKSVENL